MLDTTLPDTRIRFSSAPNWDSAVREACQPLIDDHLVEARYVDAIIENVQGPGGTYMDLGFGFMLAHARPEAGALETGLSLLCLNHEVPLAGDESHLIKVVIALAAEDASSHLQTIADLGDILTDEGRRNELLNASKISEVLKALGRY